MMMLNNMFMFHYQLNQNTSCKVKLVNMNRQPKRLSNHRHRRRCYQPFYLSHLPHWWCRVNFGELLWVYPGVRGF